MIRLTCVFIGVFVVSNVVSAGIIETGDLNIIDDVGNPSHGLRYLNVDLTANMTLADALTFAQTNYVDGGDFRAATATEWDDLFSAAGITYSGANTASDAFEIGSDDVIVAASSPVGVLGSVLGTTVGTSTIFFSDPDGDVTPTTTRDQLVIADLGAASTATIGQSPIEFSDANVGWLLVSATAIPNPEPSSLIVLTAFLLGGIVRRGKRAPLESP